MAVTRLELLRFGDDHNPGVAPVFVDRLVQEQCRPLAFLTGWGRRWNSAQLREFRR